MTTINFIQKKSFKEKAYKTLNVFVGVVTILNVSMVGALVRPTATSAATVTDTVVGMAETALNTTVEPTAVAGVTNASANLDQCANDPSPSSNHDGCNTDASQWVNGNVGASKAVYFEGDTIPYRMQFDGLSLDSHTVTFEWDTTKSGKHAIDYLTSYNRTVTTADPCLGVAGCTASTSGAIPADPQVTGAGITPVAGNFTLFGGTITAVSAYAYDDGTGFTGDKSARITVTFTANAANPVLAWGGHISDRHDWGVDNSAISISGSPYHTRLIDLDGSGGNQDRSLSAEAVIFPGSITIVKQATPESAQSFAYTTTGGLTPSTFSLVDDGTTANTKAFGNVLNFTTYTVTESPVLDWTLSFNAPVCEVTTANGGSQTASGSTVTVNLNEGENVTCTFKNKQETPVLTPHKTVENLTHPGATTVANPPHVGDVLLYTLSVTNSGTADKTGYVFTDDVSAIVTYASDPFSISDSGSYNGTTKVVSWPSTTIAKSTTVNRTFRVTVDDPLPSTGDFKMVNVFGDTVTVPLCHLVITKWQKTGTGAYTKDPIAVNAGDTISYKITVENNGTGNCTGGGVKITDAIDPELNFTSQTPGTGVNFVTVNGGVIEWNANTIEPKTTKQVEWTATANPSRCGAFSIPNTAKAYADQYHEMTQALTSNTVYATGSKLCYGTLIVEKVMLDPNGNVITGDTHPFTVTVNGADAKHIAVGTDATYTNLPIGTYTVVENADANYLFVSYSIDANVSLPGAQVTVSNGQTTTLTVTNQQKKAKITINKSILDADGNPLPSDTTSFGVTGTASGSVSQTAPFVTYVDPGTAASFTETGNPWYTTLNGSCMFDASNVTSNANLSCTFVNQLKAAKLTVIKVVHNDHGGNAVVADFPLYIGTTSVTSGVATTLTAGTYTVSEQMPLPAGYRQVSIVCDGGATDTVTLNPGDEKSCTITNEDIAPQITLIKDVTNDNGGLAGVNDFGLTIGGTAVDSGTTLDVNSNMAIALNEAGLTGYSFVNITGDTKCPAALNGTVTLDEGEHITCTIHNDDQPGTLIVKKTLYNFYGGNNVITDFSFTVNGGTSIGFEADGRNDLTVNAGTYSVIENAAPGYRTTYEYDTIHDNCNSVVVPNGGSAICFITNVDIAPSITLKKEVVNDNGGTAGVNDFGLTIGGTAVYSGETRDVTANVPITLNEAGLTGYSFVNITGDAKCPSVLNGTVTLDEGEHVTCTIHNDDIQPKLTVIKVVHNDHGGNAVVADFPLFVGATSVTSGVQNGFNAGNYIVSETQQSGYDLVSITGDCDPKGSVNLTVGDVKTCTITNEDIAPRITLIKDVKKDNGGTAGVNDFGLTIGGTPVNSGDTLAVEANKAIALNEAGLTGYDFVNITGDAKCPSVLNGTVTLDEGEHVTCTIHNDDQVPHLTLIKHVTNNNGGTALTTDFTLTATGPTTISGLGNASSGPGFSAGEYTLSETGPTGYGASAWTCTGGVQNGNKITVALGQSATCEITNDDNVPHLTLVKHVTNDDGGKALITDFMLTATGPTTISGAGGTVSGPTFSAGEYALSESTLTAGYTPSAWTCTGGVQNGDKITVALGQSATCEITNDDIAPTIKLTKVVNNDHHGNAGVNDFGLTIGGTPVNSGDTLAVEANKEIALNEVGVTGYQFVSLTGDTACPSVLGESVVLNPGDSISCTITNEDIAPRITLIKDVKNDNGGTAGVDSFGLTIGGTPVNSGVTLDVNSNTLIALNEAGLTGYDFVNITGDAKCPAVLGGTVTLDEGEHVTCTIHNDDQIPHLTLFKTVITDNGGTAVKTDWTLEATGTTTPLSGTTPVVSGADFKAGTYTLSEKNGPSGYSASVWTCTGGTQNGDTISIKLGESATCGIINDDIAPSLTLVKHVVNMSGSTAITTDWTLTATGPTTIAGLGGAISGTDFSAGEYTLNETGPSGYSASAWTCTGQGTQNGDKITIGLAETATCDITNTRDTGTVIVHKQVDTNGDGIYEITNDTDANALGFLWSLNGGATNRAMGTSETVTTLIDHTVNENSVQNYHYVGYFIGEGTCNDPSVTQLPINFRVEKSNLTNPNPTEITLCNARDTGTLIVKKHVVNLDGGQKVASEFSMTINGVNVLGTSTFPGDEAGTTRTVATGVYNVTEVQLPGYTASYSTDCAGTIAYGETKTCTITNDDIVSTIGLVKTATPATVNAGENITYTLAWSVTGVNPVHDAILTDPLPANTTFVSANCGTTVGTCTIDSSTSTISWTLGTRNAGETGTVTFVVKTASPIVNGTVITNTGTFDTTETPPVTSTVNTPVVSAPILSITKSNDLTTFTTPGKVVNYTVVVTNASTATDTARNVVMTDTLPAGFTFASDGTTTKTFAIGDLAPGQSKTTTFLVNISGTQVAGTYVNTAKAKGDNTTEVTATSPVEVRVPTVLTAATPELTITKTVSKKTAKPNEILTYTITVKNIGVGDATNVVVTDTLPKDLSFAHATGRTMTWKLGTLEAGHSRVLNVDVRVESDATKGSYTNVAEVTADEIPALQASVTITVPAVLGLATTGTGALDYLIALLGAALILFGVTGLSKRKQREITA